MWKGTILTVGYGCIRFGGRKGKLLLAHRVSYELHIKPIENDLCVLHHCDNPVCVNPEHLFLGTRTDNMIDKVRKNRQSFTPGKKGEQSPNTHLTDDDVVQIRNKHINGVSFRSLAIEFGISKRSVGRIIHCETWTHL